MSFCEIVSLCRGGVGWAGSSSAFGVLESVAVAVALDDMAAMSQAIQGCSGQPFAAEHFDPAQQKKLAEQLGSNKWFPLVKDN